MKGTRLGLFELESVIGTGGMGEVWQARHLRTDTAVAIKLLTAAGAKQPEYRRAFRNETRAVAALDHPNIVLVFDHGEVSAAEAEASDFEVGTAYLAMELALGGTLSRWKGRLSWRHLRRVLLALLDALAHAHARGVIHRDLKPGNVLLGQTDDSNRLSIRLTDFGLAHALAHADKPIAGGTPFYMAPEQFAGQWRDYGPWTDLYSLGCLAWALATGKAPFRGNTVQIAAAHLMRDPPPLECEQAMPAGFEPWLRRLLAKTPGDRYRRAADAAWALLQIPDEGPTEELMMPIGTEERFTDPRTLAGSHTTLVWPVGASRPPPSPDQDEREYDAAAPIPADWKRRTDTRATQLVGAGLGLWGLRPIPLVGRAPVRTALWEALREVSLGPQVVCIEGPSGSGKSRLGQWLYERAHEVGAAVTLRANHAPLAGPADGLAPMLSRHLGCVGLAHEQLHTRIEGVFLERGLPLLAEASELAELIAPAVGEASFRFASATERWTAMRRVLEGVATERPLVVWLDDVQWGLDALGFVEHVLSQGSQLPVLFVLTAADEALAERPDAHAHLERLLRDRRSKLVRIGPLPEQHRHTLVQELLGLEGDLARQVEQRSAGNPLFAVQLVGDWVERGLLVVGERGFRLQEGASASLPDTLHQVWNDRLDRLLEGAPDTWSGALEIAATLGLLVDGHEWRAACAAAGFDAPDELVDQLVARRLAVADPMGPRRGWSFTHRMLVESLERRAREGGRLAACHQACAQVLALTGHANAGRLGTHLLMSGAPGLALIPLTRGVRNAVDIGDYGTAETLLVSREQALSDETAGEDDVRWGEGWLQRFRIERRRGNYDGAEAWLDRTDAGDWPLLKAWVRLHRVQLEHLRGRDVDVAELQSIAELAGGLSQDDARVLLAECLLEHGKLLAEADDLQAARTLLERSRKLYEAQNHLRGQSLAWEALADVARTAGELSEALTLYERAKALYHQRGFRWGLASTHRGIGAVHEARDDPGAAERHYRESYRLFRALGSEAAVEPLAALGRLLAGQDDARATEVLRQAIDSLERQGRTDEANDLRSLRA